MESTNLSTSIIEQYKNGQRHFSNYDLENENFENQNLQDIVFENCFISSNFKKTNLKRAKFINSNIKTSDFSYADLSYSHFEHLTIDSTIFTGAKTIGIYFENNDFQGKTVSKLDFEKWWL